MALPNFCSQPRIHHCLEMHRRLLSVEDVRVHKLKRFFIVSMESHCVRNRSWKLGAIYEHVPVGENSDTFFHTYTYVAHLGPEMQITQRAMLKYTLNPDSDTSFIALVNVSMSSSIDLPNICVNSIIGESSNHELDWKVAARIGRSKTPTSLSSVEQISGLLKICKTIAVTPWRTLSPLHANSESNGSDGIQFKAEFVLKMETKCKGCSCIFVLITDTSSQLNEERLRKYWPQLIPTLSIVVAEPIEG